MIGIAISGALCAAGANAAASVLQRKADRDEPDEVALSPRLVLDLLQRPAWLGGVAAITAGFLLQALALANGQLSLVEPLLVLELPLTLLVASRVFHKRLHRHEWLAIGGMTLGLIVLLYCLRPQAGDRSMSAIHWVLGIGVTLAVVAGLVASGRRSQGTGRAARYGVATGTSFGLTAVLVSVMSTAASHGLGTIFTIWQTYGLVASGLLGMFLLQNALQAGPLVAAQPGFTLADPLVAMTWGILLFGERIRLGPWLAGELGGGVLIAVATFRLIRSPLLQEASGASDDEGAEGAEPAAVEG